MTDVTACTVPAQHDEAKPDAGRNVLLMGQDYFFEISV